MVVRLGCIVEKVQREIHDEAVSRRFRLLIPTLLGFCVGFDRAFRRYSALASVSVTHSDAIRDLRRFRLRIPMLFCFCVGFDYSFRRYSAFASVSVTHSDAI